MDLSQYRITEYSQLNKFKEKMGKERFYEYAKNVYKRLFKMKPGETFDITRKVARENWDMFIKIACCYIFDFPGFMTFNEEFTQLTCQK